jgi:hypothetical protein
MGAALLLSGCGPKRVKIEGKVVREGQPLKVGQGEKLNLSLTGTDDKGSPAGFVATLNGDGGFVLDNIPTGKYQLRLNIIGGGSDPADLAKFNEINKQFEAANAKLEYEVTADSTQTITVDVGKVTVTKQ